MWQRAADGVRGAAAIAYDPLRDAYESVAGSLDRFSKEAATRYQSNLIRGILRDIPQYAGRAPSRAPDRSGKRGPIWDRLKIPEGTTYQALGAKPPTEDELKTLNNRDLSELRQSLSEPIRLAAQSARNELAAINVAADKVRDEIAAALPEGALAGDHYARRAEVLRARLDEALAKENEARKLTGEESLTAETLVKARAAIDKLVTISNQLIGTVKDTATLEATRAELARKMRAAESTAQFKAAKRELEAFEDGLEKTAGLMKQLDDQRRIVSSKKDIAGLTAPLARQASTGEAPAAAPAVEVRAPASLPRFESVWASAVRDDQNFVTVDLRVPDAEVINLGGRTFSLANGRGRFRVPVDCCGNAYPQMWVGSQGKWRFSTVLSIHNGQDVKIHLQRQ